MPSHGSWGPESPLCCPQLCSSSAPRAAVLSATGRRPCCRWKRWSLRSERRFAKVSAGSRPGGAARGWAGSLTVAGLSHRLCRAADGHDRPHQGAEPQPGHPLLGVQALRDSNLLPQGTYPPSRMRWSPQVVWVKAPFGSLSTPILVLFLPIFLLCLFDAQISVWRTAVLAPCRPASPLSEGAEQRGKDSPRSLPDVLVSTLPFSLGGPGSVG